MEQRHKDDEVCAAQESVTTKSARQRARRPNHVTLGVISPHSRHLQPLLLLPGNPAPMHFGEAVYVPTDEERRLLVAGLDEATQTPERSRDWDQVRAHLRAEQ